MQPEEEFVPDRLNETNEQNEDQDQSFPIRKFSLAMAILLLSTILHYYVTNGYNVKLEIEKCPFCYGTNLCPAFENLEINFDDLSYSDTFFNLLNTKNVYISNYNTRKVILKKLAHDSELNDIDKKICTSKNLTEDECPPFPESKNDYTNRIIEFLSNENNTIVMNLNICSRSTLEKFINVVFAHYAHLNTSYMTANIWTTLLANAEPLFLQILNERDGWPVPKYYGACGRIIVEEFCGNSLNSITDHSWYKRAKIALELLIAADEFTNNHPIFRFYLTDLSSDNIAITDDYKIKFIDFENVIISEKMYNFDDSRLHESIDLDCENCYAFSTDDICSHSISDHNIYSVCKLLLSKNSPWPMMKNGLLHSIPENITKKYPEFENLIEVCAESSPQLNRFKSSKLLMSTIEKILEDPDLPSTHT